MKKSPTSWHLVLAGLLLLATPVVAPAQVVTKLLVLPAQMRLEAGATGQISVEVQDQSSRPIPLDRAPVLFVSSDSTIATVSTDGAVRGLREGRTEIVVRAGSRVRSVAVVVSGSGAGVVARPAAPAPAPQVAGATAAPATTPAATPAPAPTPALPREAPVGAAIQPLSIQLLQGERMKPSFRLVYADGRQLETRDVVWSIFGAAIAFDSNSNEVVGVGPGPATLTGKYGATITSAVPVSVGESVLVFDHDSLELVAGGQDTVSLLVPAQGRRKVTQNLTWRTTDPGIVRVLTPTEGVVEGVTAGTATLIVDGYGAPRILSVRVVPRIARVETAPAPGTTITVGASGTLAFQAKPFGTDGTAQPSAALRWRVDDSTVARIDQRGLVTGVRQGMTRIRLDAPGLETMVWPLTTVATRVTFDVEATSMLAGTSKRLPVTLRGADASSLGLPIAPQFSSLTPAVLTVDAAGTMTGVQPGRAAVVVTQAGAGADTVTVFVTGRALIAGSIKGERGLWQLVGAEDTVPTLLARLDSGGQVSQAVWSPDRTRIALTFEPMERGLLPRVMVLDADGQNWKNLSPDTVAASDPSWTRDGSAVLMTARDPKSSATSVLRVGARSRDATVLITSTVKKFRFPIAEADTASVLVRVEANGQLDIARVLGGTTTNLTEGKPREELIAGLPAGRVLVAIDSSSRGRPATLQSVSPMGAGVDSIAVIPVPPGLIIADISAGYDAQSVIVVARARSWQGASGPALLVLRIALDGRELKTLLLLNEKDLVSVRTQ
jgi:uncharacterized protein YjdB